MLSPVSPWQRGGRLLSRFTSSNSLQLGKPKSMSGVTWSGGHSAYLVSDRLHDDRVQSVMPLAACLLALTF
jgi:hypothetical protein